jgi:hypothetical protein
MTAYLIGRVSLRMSAYSTWEVLNKFYEECYATKGLDSSVDIAMRYGLDGCGSIPGNGKRIFLRFVQTVSEANPAMCPVRTRGCYDGGIRTRLNTLLLSVYSLSRRGVYRAVA